MAKRKTPKVKKEELVDLTPKPEKITDEQLKSVQNIINSINQHQMEIGSMETRKHQLLHNLSQLQEQLSELQGELQVSYNTIDINIETGEINYPPENGETDKED